MDDLKEQYAGPDAHVSFLQVLWYFHSTDDKQSN